MDSYLKLCTQAYDTDKPEVPPDALEFYLRYAREASGPILEPMCGSGRFLVPLTQHGFDVDGTDASPHMLKACREKCRALGLSPNLYEQYLHETDLPREYGLVVIPAGSFGLVTDPAQAQESLARIHAAMLPGARFVLEIEKCDPAAQSCSWPWGGRWYERPDGAKIIFSWVGRYDAEERVNHSIHRYELVKDGRLLETEFEDFRLRSYEVEEFRALLETAGFVDIRTRKVYGDFEPDDADEELVFECSKPG